MTARLQGNYPNSHCLKEKFETANISPLTGGLQGQKTIRQEAGS